MSMGHKTDMRRYAPSIARVARARVAAAKSAPSPEVEMCKQDLGTLTVTDARYKSPRTRTWQVIEFF
jgi:hypothetical protein